MHGLMREGWRKPVLYSTMVYEDAAIYQHTIDQCRVDSEQSRLSTISEATNLPPLVKKYIFSEHYSSLCFMKLLCLAFVSTKTRVYITLFSVFVIDVTTTLGASVIVCADCG